ncbi:S-layer homology domain-containing protein [Paenibacillus yonginensis]|nr:S-layer homology domain-containing protein [Paenibacillus yonginensis]
MLALTLFLSAADNFGGASLVLADGSQDAPPVVNGWVTISNTDQLLYVDQHQAGYLDQKLRLANDIQLSGYDWIPLGGNLALPFSGTFDGRGHLISGISISGAGLDNVGFFGEVSGTVKNLGLEVQVADGENTGGIAGYLNGGKIDHSYTLGSVKGRPSTGVPDLTNLSVAGGLVGASVNSSITRSYSAASITTGYASNVYGGGLVGSQGSGEISDSYSIGALFVQQAPNSYSFIRAGGLTSFLIYGSIADSFAASSIDTANLDTFYYQLLGGLAADAPSGPASSRSYFDSVVFGHLDEGSGAAPKATAEMQQQSTYTGWDFEGTWAMPNSSSVNGGYPYLRPEILTEELPDALSGTAYSLQLEAFAGAAGGLSWSATGLPDGLVLDADTGFLHGTPAEQGLFSVDITVTDAALNSAHTILNLNVGQPAPDIAGLVVEPGHAMGAVKAVVDSPADEIHFAYSLTEADTRPERPLVGVSMPADAVSYTMGSDITNVSPGQYITFYQLDDNRQIEAWSSLQLTADQIQSRIAVTGVSLEPEELTLIEGQEPVQLTALIQPDDASNKSVSWTSSDSTKAFVDPFGRITPYAAGKVWITVTTEDGGYHAQTTVTIQPRETAGTVTGSVYGLSERALSDDSTLSENVTDTTGNAVMAPANAGRLAAEFPLEGATIKLGRTSGGQTTSGINGAFMLNDVPEGSQMLIISADGYVSKEIPVSVTAGETIDIGRITLEPVAPEEPGGNPPGNNPGSGGDGPPSSPSGGSGIPPMAPVAPTLLVQINGLPTALPATKETASDGRSVIRLTLNDSLLQKLFASDETAVLEAEADDELLKVDLPSSALDSLLGKQPGSKLLIRFNRLEYLLPLNLWEDAPSGKVKTIAIGKAAAATIRVLNASLSAKGFRLLADPAEFSLNVDNAEWTGPKDLYTERAISLINSGDLADPADLATPTGLTGPVDPETSTVVWMDDYNQPHFIPSVFQTDNAAAKAVFYSPHNSLYAVVQGKRDFTDITGHWAGPDIKRLANKFIVDGLTSTTFAPDRPVTRGEFANMLVNALGFAGPATGRFENNDGQDSKPDVYSNSELDMDRGLGDSNDLLFSDVLPQAWYAGAVKTAAKSGIITGYSDETFGPDNLVNREQLAVMIVRAIHFAGTSRGADSGPFSLDTARMAVPFSDAAAISSWAQASAAELSAAQILLGNTSGFFEPKAYATRAECAAVLSRMLEALGFINPPSN